MVTGCAVGPQYVWSNPEFEQRGASQQQLQSLFGAHQSECQYRALKMANEMYPEPVQPQVTRITGTVDGRPINATATTAPASPNSAVFQGFIASQRRIDRERAIEDIFTVCLSEKGWQRTAVGR